LWLTIGLPVGVAVLLVLAAAVVLFVLLPAPGTGPAPSPPALAQAGPGQAPAQAEPPAGPAAPPVPAPPAPLPPAAPGPDLGRVLTIDLPASTLAYDRVHGHLYAAVGSTAPRKGNTVTALNPATGATLWSVNVGSDPAVLAASGDGQALWVGLAGAPSIQRVDLVRRTAGPLLPLGNGSFGPSFVEQMQVLPGTTDTVVVSLQRKGVSPRHDGVAVYDNGVRRPDKTRDHTGSNRIACTEDPGLVLGYNNETTEFGLRRLTVDAGGIHEGHVSGGVIQGFNVDITYAGGRLYSTSGAVVDARNAALVGTLPARGPVTVDAEHKRAYYLVTDGRRIEAYDTDRLTKVGACNLPANLQDVQGPLVQVGGTALALRTRAQVVVVPLKDVR
jgi:hypothetical protein